LTFYFLFSLDYTGFSDASKEKVEEICLSLNRPVNCELKLYYRDFAQLRQAEYLEKNY